MEIKNGVKTFYPKTRKDWRQWLLKNHQVEKSVWLIMHHKNSDQPGINYAEAVEEALCFGWIDSKAIKRDSRSHYQYFSQRKAKSKWSKINRERAERMIREGLMAPAGKAMIDLAKQTGTWEALADVENTVIPEDLKKRFDRNQRAFRNFQSFAPSSQRVILGWILNAKKPGTRKKRIEETVKLAAKKIKANH